MKNNFLYIAGSLIILYLIVINMITKRKKIDVFELENKLHKYIPELIARIIVFILYSFLAIIYLLIALGVLFLLIQFIKWAWYI